MHLVHVKGLAKNVRKFSYITLQQPEFRTQTHTHTPPVEQWKLQLHAGNICIYCGVGKNTYEYSDKHFGVLRH